MSNKRRHHDRKSTCKKRQNKRRETNRKERIRIDRKIKSTIADALKNGLTGLRHLALEAGIPFLRVYGEPYHIDTSSPGPVEVAKLKKRIYYKLLESGDV